MGERLLVVEEAFVTRGRGVLLAPRFTLSPTLEMPRAGAFRVMLRFPGGTEREASAELEISHVRGTLAPYAMLRLTELTPDDVPELTEVWTIA